MIDSYPTKTMKLKNSLILLSAVLPMLPALGGGATLTVEPEIPTADVLLSRGDGAPLGTAGIQQAFGFRNADAAGTEGTRGRGQSFVINGNPGATYDISSLSVSLGNSGDDAGYRPDGVLTFTVFSWDGDDADDFSAWNFDTVTMTGGTGGMTDETVELYRTSFVVPTEFALSGTGFLTIAFDAGELSLTDGTAYGFFFRYVLDELVDENGDPLNEDVTIAFDSDNGAPDDAPGALLNTNVTTEGFESAPNLSSATRDLNYFITGTAAESDFKITDISRTGDTLSLTWDSAEDVVYVVRYSFDCENWLFDLNDGVTAGPGDSTTMEFDLTQFNIQDEPAIFFRIEK